MSLHDVAEAEDHRRATLPGYHADSFAAGAEWGAGWVLAVIGMAEAIRKWKCPYCDCWRFKSGRCFCLYLDKHDCASPAVAPNHAQETTR